MLAFETMLPSAGTGLAPAEGLARDADAWDAFVAASPTGSYLQTSAWARVKARNGWRAERIVVADAAGPIGIQLLVRPLGPLPWSVGYGPRAPITLGGASADGVRELTARLRATARRARLTHVVVDPAIERGDPLETLLLESGWRRTRSVQPVDRTRLIDLLQGEAALWADLRPKWRQYVNRARRAGVTVQDAGVAGIDAFYEVYLETARRAGFVVRSRQAYADVVESFDRSGAARLLLAREADGSPSATLIVLACGRRVVEPYGGMTAAGAASRANYLLKWEAIRSSAERGFAIYDLWGIAHGGIDQFKTGFGGREVRYIGGWEIVTDPAGRAVFGLAHRGRVTLARWRHGVAGRRDVPTTDEATADER